MQMKEEMPSFDPSDVIFVTNKWDSIRSQRSVIKEQEQLWKNINLDIEKAWPHVRKDHVFRMNTLDVSINIYLFSDI